MTTKPGLKECPVCAEQIRERARMCRFCGAVLTEEELPRIASREERDLIREGDELIEGNLGSEIGDILLIQHRDRLKRVLRGNDDQYRSATVLFVDLVGYTSLCSSLRPEETKEILDAYYAICGHVVDFFNGFILEFQGDGCLAVFGAPVSYERDAESAVRAGLAILERIAALPIMHNHKVRANAGMETGVVLSSVIRTRTPPVYKVFGTAVNLASRIKGVAPVGALAIGPETYEIVRDIFKTKKLGTHAFKNVEKPVAVYQVTGVKQTASARRDFTIPFLGREREIEKLQVVWRQCMDGGSGGPISYTHALNALQVQNVNAPSRCGAILEGEPGIGKTRLAIEFSARQPGVVMAHVEGAPYSAKVPWELWRGILSELIAGASRDPAGTDWRKVESNLEQLGYRRDEAMPIQALLGDPRAMQQMQALPASAARRLLRTELRILLEKIALRSEGGLILVLDDLQWSDRTSTEALNQLLEHPPARTFFLLAYRNDEGPGFEQMRRLERVRVRGLDLRSRRALFGVLADLPHLLPEIRERLIHQEAGNPFYMMELARAAGKQMAEAAEEKARQAAAARKTSKGKKTSTVEARKREKTAEELIQEEWESPAPGELVPPTLLEILQSRIDSLDQRRKLVLQCAAVLGKRFSLEFIEFFNFIQEGLLARLYSLKSLQLLEDAVTLSGLEFFFLHHVTREVSYRTLLVRQRKELHTFVAQELERRYAGELEKYAPVLAYHWTQAEDGERAVPFLKISGDQAMAMGAIPEALEHYDEALARLHRAAPTPANRRKVAELLCARGKLLRLSGQPRQSLEALASALHGVGKSKDPKLAAAIRLEAGLSLQGMGEYDRAEKELHAAWPLVQKENNPTRMAQVLNALGACAWGRGDFDGADAKYAEAAELGTDKLTPNLSADILNNRALIRWKKGALAEAESMMRKSLKYRNIAGDKFMTAITVMNLGILEENLGRLPAAEKRYREALELAQRLQFRQVLTATHANLANLELVRGQATSALQHSAQALQIAEMIEDPRSAAIAMENMALSHLLLQDVPESRRVLKEASRLATRIGDHERLFSLELVQIETALAKSEGARLKSRLAKAVQLLEEEGFEAERPRLFRLQAMHFAQAKNFPEAQIAARAAMDAAKAQRNGGELSRAKMLLQELRKQADH